MRAYVFVDSLPGNASNIVGRVAKISGVVMADAINGPHSAIVVVEDASLTDIAKTILFKIKKIEGVRDITVYLSARAKKERMNQNERV